MHGISVKIKKKYTNWCFDICLTSLHTLRTKQLRLKRDTLYKIQFAYYVNFTVKIMKSYNIGAT
jgi:hypothetical protein